MRSETHLERGKMDDTVDIGMRSEDLVQSFFICDIDLVELRSLSAEQLNAVEGNLGGIVEGIDDDDFVTMLKKGKARE